MSKDRVKRYRILLVDDEPANLNVLRQILKQDYDLAFAKSGPDALKTLHEHKPDMVLLDIMMPGIDGYQVCDTIKQDPRLSDIPVIFCTAMDDELEEQRGFQIGAVDYLTKPVRPSIVQARIRTHLALSDQNRSFHQRVLSAEADLIQSRLEALRMLGRAAEFKDNETGYHVIRMSLYSELLARASGWTDEEAEVLRNAAPMHDIGKIGIPDSILLKPGRLNEAEWAVMRQHSEMGARIIGESGGTSQLYTMAESIALSHHERWDGTGYPRGLAGEDIPLCGRVVAIADVFDALTSVRPYKTAWSVEDAIDHIQQQAGKHFDPELVPRFTELLPEIRQIISDWQDH
ncbi:response regulator [Thiohalocapsa marina]|uniref:Response regulator n=1 Tax=Thiohalocapsa marina TaxID=424902 RepID=A0A5M8FIG3_9GAMM|nr:HD domain-containing phosphohydrolase [Thiohalocapsa marina]KAA6183770.1 response regulator [Thiohalocapsa marina]